MRARSIVLLLVMVLGSAALAVAGLAVVRGLVPLPVLEADNDVAGNYLQTLGTIYAVLLAFVVFVVWSQHIEARTTTESEANELMDLFRVSRSFPEHLREPISHRALAYGQAVVNEEWARMARGEASEGASAILEEVWASMSVWKPVDAREEALFTQALERFDNLSDQRSHRLTCSRTHLPATLWALLVVGAVLTVASMWLFGLAAFGPLAIMTAAMAGSVAFVLYVILDLDNPFWGDWQITPERFEHMLARMESAIRRDESTTPRA